MYRTAVCIVYLFIVPLSVGRDMFGRAVRWGRRSTTGGRMTAKVGMRSIGPLLLILAENPNARPKVDAVFYVRSVPSESPRSPRTLLFSIVCMYAYARGTT